MEGCFFFLQAEDGIRDLYVTGVQTCALPISRQVLTAAALKSARDGIDVTVAGLVTHRQRPPTARGVVFISLEDETGMVNVICPPQVWERHQPAAATAPALLVRGRIERTGGAVSLVADALRPLTVAASLTGNAVTSRDFR